ncbi:DUF2971 domain-containing protein [Vibrio parahaemolyticus]|uniref:DUF2971 domain-containing protein n=1 Tax=Vibrio parahaemolyticus TaxID=670 RepID=UPI00387B4E9B
MKLYKYRSDDEKTLDRDLDSIIKNQVYFSELQNLNDPFEGRYTFNSYLFNLSCYMSKKLKSDSMIKHDSTTNIEYNSSLHTPLENFISRIGDYGVFSLGKEHDNELMWSHYANSHKGFCIEYDLDTLMNDEFLKYEVSYIDSIPVLICSDIDERMTLLRKIFATKSKHWSYEKEVRLISLNPGLKTIKPEAIKSICFGLNSGKETIDRVTEKLKNMSLNYYIMEMDKHSYTLIKKGL